jgi:hypothetical protein
MHVSEAADLEDNTPSHFVRGSLVQKMLFKVDSHSMNENETQCRVRFSEELLQVVRQAKETKIEHLLTGDES